MTSTNNGDTLGLEKLIEDRERLASLLGLLDALDAHSKQVRQLRADAVAKLLAEADQLAKLREQYLAGDDEAMDGVIALLFRWEADPSKPVFFTRFVRRLVADYVCVYVRNGVEKIKKDLRPDYYDRIVRATETLKEFFSRSPEIPLQPGKAN